jgi:hypothetical protein
MSGNLPEQIRRCLQREENEATHTRERALVQGQLGQITDAAAKALKQSRQLLARIDKLLSRR